MEHTVAALDSMVQTQCIQQGLSLERSRLFRLSQDTAE